MNTCTLWRTADRARLFLIPDEQLLTAGALSIWSLMREERRVDPASVVPFELTDEQARRWAKEELGRTLEELKHGIDERLATARRNLAEAKRGEVSSETAPALLDFLKALPRVIGQSLSGDERRLDTARDTMTTLQQRLRDSGLDVDDRVGNFADRLASIRTEASAKDKPSP